ncbi:MAG: hypothetical protein GY936_19340 [Ignavibacteriae bacterium]|nr:hypothetical protein [Ignavibacteriota bacterium]
MEKFLDWVSHINKRSDMKDNILFWFGLIVSGFFCIITFTQILVSGISILFSSFYFILMIGIFVVSFLIFDVCLKSTIDYSMMNQLKEFIAKTEKEEILHEKTSDR